MITFPLLDTKIDGFVNWSFHVASPYIFMLFFYQCHIPHIDFLLEFILTFSYNLIDFVSPSINNNKIAFSTPLTFPSILTDHSQDTLSVGGNNIITLPQQNNVYPMSRWPTWYFALTPVTTNFRIYIIGDRGQRATKLTHRIGQGNRHNITLIFPL